MRKVALIGTAIVLGLTTTAWAGAKDKTSNTLVDIDATGVINNTTAKTKVKSKGCSLQVQMQTVNMADGEIAICLAEADVVGIGGNSLVLTGEAKKGKFKLKADISEAAVLGLGCGSVEVINYNGSITCYEDDPIYRSNADNTTPGSWRKACLDAGMPFTSTDPGETLNKASGSPVVVGICQGNAIGQRIQPPSSARIAVQGQRTAAD